MPDSRSGDISGLRLKQGDRALRHNHCGGEAIGNHLEHVGIVSDLVA
jgi:hypothetical protein